MSGPVEPRKWKKLAKQVEELAAILHTALRDCHKCDGVRLVAMKGGGTGACPNCGSLWARFSETMGEAQ